MKRLAAAVLASGLVLASAWGQGPRVWTNPAVPAPEVLDRLNLRMGWRFRIPVEGFRDGIATVQNLGDLIIVQTDRGAVLALDPSTGAMRWWTRVGLPYPVSHRVGYNDSVILVANGTRIFGLDRPTGKELWNVDLAGTPSSPPAVNGDAFYVCLGNGRLSAYAFPIEVAPPPGTPPSVSGGPVPTGPAGTQGSAPARGTPQVPVRSAASPAPPKTAEPAKSLAVGSRATINAGVDSRSVATGMQATGGRTAVGTAELSRGGRGPAVVNAPRLLWDYQTNLRISERPAIGERHLLVTSTGPEALFIEKKGAAPQPFVADAPFSAPIGQYGDIAYAACVNGSIYAFDLATRVTLWQVTASGAITERPVATDEDLFVVSEGGGLQRHVRATGEMLWKNPAAVKFVAVNPKFVYARDNVGRLLVLDHVRGMTLTKLDLRDFTFSLPNIRTDRLILGANDGTILSLHDRAYPQPLRLANPQAVAVPAAAPATGPEEAKPETAPEPAPAPKPPAPKNPPVQPKPAPGPRPPTTPPVTPPSTPPVTPPVTPPPD